MAEDGEVQVDITGDTSDFDSAVDGLSGKVSAATVAMGTILADFGKKAVSALSGVVSSSIETGMAFENSMSNVTALQQAAGATETDIANLKQAAEDYGASTQYTMAECADALGYMALAGWDAEQSIDSLPGVLSLAAASGMGLAAASDMVTDYMSAFSSSVSDYTGEALTAAEFSDKLAYAQANSNTTAAGLGEAYKNCAANLNAAGQQMDTVTAILGTMANQGLKGSESGTALAAMMRDITASMENGVIAIGNTNVAVTDANGNYRDLIDILADIETATNGMGDAEKATALSASFTSDSIKGLNLVLNSGTESVYALETGLSSCEGAADEMAATLNDNLQGDLTYMGSALDAVKNSIYEGVEPALRSLVQSVTNDVAPQLQTLIDGILGVANGTDGASKQVQSAVDSLVSWALGLISDNLPNILNMVSSVILQVATSILNNAPQILSAVSSAILKIGDTIIDMSPDLLNAVLTGLESLIRAIIRFIPRLTIQAVELATTLVNAFGKIDWAAEIEILVKQLTVTLQGQIPKLLVASNNLFAAIIRAIPQAAKGLSEAMPEMIAAIADTITEAIPQFLIIGKNLLNTLTSIFPEIQASIFAALPDVLTAIADIFPEIIECIGEALPGIIETITDFLVEYIPLLLEEAVVFFNAIVDAIPEIIDALMAVLPDIIAAITDCLQQSIPVILEAAVTLLMAIIEALPTVIDALAEALPQIIEAIVTFLIENLELLTNAAVILLTTIVHGLLDNVDLLIDAALGLIDTLISYLLEDGNLEKLIDAAVNMVITIVEALVNSVDKLVDAALRIIDALISYLLEDDNLEKLIDAAVEMIITIVDGLMNCLDKLIDAALQIIEALIDYLLEDDNLEKLIEMAIKLVGKIAEGLVKGIGKIIEKLPEIIDAIWNGIAEVDWLELGKQILEGIASGLKNAIGSLGSTVTEVASDLWNGFKDFFGISSPSKLMRDTVGKFLLPGVVVGMEDTTSETTDKLNKSLDDIMRSLDTDRLQMQLDSTVQMQGYSSLGTALPDVKYNASQTLAIDEPRHPSDSGGNWTFPIYLTPNTQVLDTIVITAKDRANAVSGGNEF